jgi:DNA gyrase subunit A
MTGNGSVMMRAKHHRRYPRQARSDHRHEIPYQVNKGKLAGAPGRSAREKIVEDISEMRDESDRDGVRIVIELKKDAIADVVLNQLYKHTRCKRRSRATWWR